MHFVALNMAHTVVVRAVACGARGPGFDSSSDQMFFFSPQVSGGWMQPQTIV